MSMLEVVFIGELVIWATLLVVSLLTMATPVVRRSKSFPAQVGRWTLYVALGAVTGDLAPE